jgi:hypothetical protein
MQHVALKVYNLFGREVASLLDERLEAGVHSVVWNASGLPAGVYFAVLHTGAGTETRKMQVRQE